MGRSATPREDECEDAIISGAMALGFYVHAERRSRTKDGWKTAVKGRKGWPDLVIVGYGHAWFLELKRDVTGKVDAEQQEWALRLRQAGLDARIVWVPSQQQALIDELLEVRNAAIHR